MIAKFFYIVFLVCIYIFGFSQTVIIKLEDSLLVDRRLSLYSAWNKGYYVEKNSVSLTKAYLKNYFNSDIIPFDYGYDGVTVVYSLDKGLNKGVIPRNHTKIESILVTFPKAYLVAVNYIKGENFLYEFDLEKKGYKQTLIKTNCKHCDFLPMINKIGNDLVLYGFFHAAFSKKVYFCTYNFNTKTCKSVEFQNIFSPNNLLYSCESNFINTKSDFLWSLTYFPSIGKNLPNNFIYDFNKNATVATFVNPNFGFVNLNVLLEGGSLACGTEHSLVHSFNSFQYSGIKRFQYNGKIFFAQSCIEPVKLNAEFLNSCKEKEEELPLKHRITIWDSSLSVIINHTFKEDFHRIIDIDDRGIFASRTISPSKAIIYRYSINMNDVESKEK